MAFANPSRNGIYMADSKRIEDSLLFTTNKLDIESAELYIEFSHKPLLIWCIIATINHL